MAFRVPIDSNSIADIAQREGRPVRLVNGTDGQACTKALSKNDSFFTADNRAGGNVVLAPGRGMWVTSLEASSQVGGDVFGYIRTDGSGEWVSVDEVSGGGLVGEHRGHIPKGGGTIIIPVNAYFNTSFEFQLRMAPQSHILPKMYATVHGKEVTDDMFLDAVMKVVFATDSVGWSLQGDWLAGDQAELPLAYSNVSNPKYLGKSLAAFRFTEQFLRGEKNLPIRLVNKGYGGSEILKKQFFSLMTNLYQTEWNLLMIQIGANDARNPLTPFKQLIIRQRLLQFLKFRETQTYNQSSVTGGQKPVGFMTVPLMDDKGYGINARSVMDCRVKLDNEDGYSNDEDISANGALNLNLAADAPYDIRVYNSGGTAINQAITNGVDGRIYRLDFENTTTLILSSGITRVDLIETYYQEIGPNQTIDIPAGTVLFIEVVDSANGIYREVERSSLIGTKVQDFTADTGSNRITPASKNETHFICSNQTNGTVAQRNRLQSIDPLAFSQVNDIDSLDFRGGNNVYATCLMTFTASSNFTTDDLPLELNIATSDVYVYLEGINNGTGATGTSWDTANGWHRIVGYTANSSGQIVQLEINFDARKAGGTDFDTNADVSSATARIFKTRNVVIEIEGNSASTSSNCVYIVGGRIRDYGYYKTQLVMESNFDIVAGQSIAFGIVQEYNTFYLKEIARGEIINSGQIHGVAGTGSPENGYDQFYSQTEDGKARVGIINSIINSVATDATWGGNSNEVYLVDLAASTSAAAEGVSVTTGGRIKYLTTTSKNAVSNSTNTERWFMGDIIDDPMYKGVGSGINERMRGRAIHYSAMGHKVLYEAMKTAFQNVTIPY